MNRVEKYRQRRITRKKYISAALIFFFLLTAGIVTVDYATNYLVSGRKGFALAAFDSHDTILEITIMNRKIYINTQYINRDLNKLRNEMSNLFQNN